MMYLDGTEVREGDAVLIDGKAGVIRTIIRPGTRDADSWSVPDGGVLIEGGGLGLSVTKSLEHDKCVVFVRRGVQKDTSEGDT